MPTKVTLDTILPAIWRGLELDPIEIQRPISHMRFDKIMTSTETIVSPPVLKRMWATLVSSQYARPSLDTETVFLDVAMMRARLYSLGMRVLVSTKHTQNTHIPEDLPGDIKERSQ